MTGSIFVVDDQDPSITYDSSTGFWVSTKESDASDGTVTSGLAGAKANFTFSGTAVGVYGWTASVANAAPPAIKFSVDGQVIQTTVAPNNGSSEASKYTFFGTELDAGTHLLEMDVLNATDQYPFVFDYILYEPSGGASTEGSQSTFTGTIPIASATSISASTGGSSGTPVGAIVGGVVGGVAVIVATIIAVWFLFFRHKKSNQPYFYATADHAADLLDHEEIKPTPYAVPPSVSTAPSSTMGGSQYQGPPPQAQSAYSAPTTYSHPPSGLNQPTYATSEGPLSDYGSSAAGPSGGSQLGLAPGSQPRVTSSPNQPMSKAAEAGLLSVPQQATFHADSGIRFDQNGQPQPVAGSSSSGIHAPQELSDVPPSYSAS